MGLIDSWKLEKGLPELKRRVRQAVIKAAIAIHAEGRNTPNHEARLQWAKMVLQRPTRYGDLVLSGVCVNPAIVGKGNEATDADVQGAVDGLVDAYTPYQPEAQPSQAVARAIAVDSEGETKPPGLKERLFGA